MTSGPAFRQPHLGWQRAARLGGNRKDRLQYAIVFALILAVAGLFVTIFVHRAAA
jgi:hypothetical protein